LISSLLLAIDRPLENPESDFKMMLSYLDLSFTVIFALELILKVISSGFIYNHDNNNNAYLRNSWNVLDFVVVSTSIIDQSGITNIHSLKALKTLRVLRALRPLRVVSRNENLKIIVDALFQTIPVLTTLIYVSGMMVWIFGILNMHTYKDQYYYCVIEKSLLSLIITKDDCLEYGG